MYFRFVYNISYACELLAASIVYVLCFGVGPRTAVPQGHDLLSGICLGKSAKDPETRCASWSLTSWPLRWGDSWWKPLQRPFRPSNQKKEQMWEDLLQCKRHLSVKSSKRELPMQAWGDKTRNTPWSCMGEDGGHLNRLNIDCQLSA